MFVSSIYTHRPNSIFTTLAMENHWLLPFHLFLIFSSFLLYLNPTVATETEDKTEQWGYVEVRTGACLFWWHYKSPHRVNDPSKPWPIILWHEGGPGVSVEVGNFQKIGPAMPNLWPRDSTWLRKADLLFVDSPVGTGFSYVVGDASLVTTDEQAAEDLIFLLKELFNGNEALQRGPLYIFGESYGGKIAVALGLKALKEIKKGELRLKLGGIALGNSWISPEDFVFSWGPLLKDLSRLDDNGLDESTSLALKIKQQLADENYHDATSTWDQLTTLIESRSNNVDFNNFLRENEVVTNVGSTMDEKYSWNFTSKVHSEASPKFAKFMNDIVRDKLRIIPENVIWKSFNELVFEALRGNFMKPMIQEVDELLAEGVSVTIYNGQFDLICSTKGVEAWVKKLKWDGLTAFLKKDRVSIEFGTIKTAGFKRSHENLAFYWILNSGHCVPINQRVLFLRMVGEITKSPSPV